MSQDLVKKEALFNEVKGSLFEYLTAKKLSIAGSTEAQFQAGLDRNYMTVLSQQDRMVRQFYPEMFPFLEDVATKTAKEIEHHLGKLPASVRVVGKFSHSALAENFHEADLILDEELVSLKLNKKNAFVNTKSGGIKSFFSQYFPYLSKTIQDDFNQLVDLEFNRMAHDLHAHHDLEFPGNFSLWVREGFSELPGELDRESREILKAYYARIAAQMHRIFTLAEAEGAFQKSLLPLLGFGQERILQVICFHDFPHSRSSSIELHAYGDVLRELPKTKLLPFAGTSSVELSLGPWDLQVRVKPMNKFTTTAIKINCSVRVKRPSTF
jgi:hypothetical protein